MSTPDQITDQINKIIGCLVEVGLSDDQNFAFQRPGIGGIVETTFQNANRIGFALRNHTYAEIYEHLALERAYNTKLADGAMIQMMYVFSSGVLERHRLAFFPSPFLQQFQNDPDIYLEDELYADIVAKNIVAFPIRFDYEAGDASHTTLEHPKSHLTLGQYRNCRIPVTAPVSPVRFIDFILRNFYHTAFSRYAEHLPVVVEAFPDSIVQAERTVIHVVVPA